MDSLSVLVCSREREWRRDVVASLAGTHQIIEKEEDPEYVDLCVHEEQHPPDIVVWQLNLLEAKSRSAYTQISRWARGTKFVLVGASEIGFAYAQASPPIPQPCALLDYSSSPSEVAEAIAAVTLDCWWTELSLLEVPACELSINGRILRANICMRQEFGPLADNPYFRVVVEGVDMEGAADLAFPAVHPVEKAKTTKRACADFVQTKHGQVQMVCVPNLLRDGSLETISVLMPDTRRRAKVFDFAHEPKARTIRAIHHYVAECVVNLGFKRARLYRFDEERRLLRGVASRGFRDAKKRRYFETRFRMPVDLDEPSSDILRQRLPSLCIYDPDERHVDEASRFVRVYRRRKRRRAFVRLLELEGANRWIEAPLVVPGTDQVVGKIVADKGEESDCLSVRDALDLGCLGMMAAGAIYACQEAEQKQELSRHSTVLKEIHDLLPRIAFEQNEKGFYRVIASILSCESGLRWERVMLFVADPSGLRQARCVMALGAPPEDVRQQLPAKYWTLQHYVDDALEHPVPEDDYLYETWVAFDPKECQLLRFDDGPTAGGPLAELLARPTDRRYREIVVSENAWCQKINEQVPDTFKGERIYAYPLTKSYALGMEMDDTVAATQPVGVAVVGMVSEGGEADNHTLVFTRVVLDLLGPLIAQRWTNQRMQGMFGALYSFHHCPLNRTWETLKAAADEWSRKPDDDDLRLAYESQLAAHDEQVRQIHFAQSTIENLGRVSDRELDLAGCLSEYRPKWESEWDGQRGRCQLRLKIRDIPEDLRLDCHPVVFCDAATCLVRNAAEAATRRGRSSVSVEITADDFAESPDFVEIVVSDDAGGVEESMTPFLFVKGASSRREGLGRGLALARAGLLMYNGDLQYAPDRGAGRATFRILLRKRRARVRA